MNSTNQGDEVERTELSAWTSNLHGSGAESVASNDAKGRLPAPYCSKAATGTKPSSSRREGSRLKQVTNSDEAHTIPESVSDLAIETDLSSLQAKEGKGKGKTTLGSEPPTMTRARLRERAHEIMTGSVDPPTKEPSESGSRAPSSFANRVSKKASNLLAELGRKSSK